MRAVLMALILVACPFVAEAQTLSSVSFPENPDHSVQFLGANVVDRYDLTYDTVPPSSAVVVDLGKPAPSAGVITVSNVSIPATLTPNQEYTATITAVGPGGASESPASAPFGVPGPPSAQGAPSVTP